MSDTTRDFKSKNAKPVNASVVKSHPSVLPKPSPIAPKVSSSQPNLSTTVAEHLLKLMFDVTKEDVTPQSVDAACKCAKEIHKIIRMNLDFSR